jgi:hypothetical protein
MTVIRSFASGGVQLDFPNGKTISIMFGAGAYGSNYDESLDTKRQVEAEKCEVAVFDSKGDQWYYPYNLNPVDPTDGVSHVESYVSVEKVLAMIEEVRNMK